MKKKLAIFGLAIIVALSALLSGVLAPLLSNYVSQAANHSDNVANYTIENLPSKNYTVGDDIQSPTVGTGVHFTLSKRVSNRDKIIGASDDTGLATTDSRYGKIIGAVGGVTVFDSPGTYVFKFYDASEWTNENGTSFHSYTVNVSASTFTIALPTNSEDILPNVTIPNSTAALTDSAQAVLPLTLPLPKSVYDLKGRDLLDLDEDENREALINAYIPQIKDKENTDEAGARALLENKEIYSDEDLKNLVYADMTITFYGNLTGPAVGHNSTTGIINKADRTFIPTVEGGNYYAEYSYKNTYNGTTASHRTSNITVEKPSKVLTNTDLANVKNNILFNPKPSMSFTPSSSNFTIGADASLPVPTVTVSSDSDIQFDSTSTITNYTYIVVRYRESSSKSWQYISSRTKATKSDNLLHTSTAESSTDILRITDYKFAPLWTGEYQFIYYTTTIFGCGKVKDFTSYTDTDGTKYIKHNPGFGDKNYLEITRDSVAPSIKWTADYEYAKDNDGNTFAYYADDSANKTPIVFEDAVDYSKYLPGSTTSSKTKIKKGSSLVVPALLGDDNQTSSDQLNYQLYLYRYENGVRASDPIYWSSGLHGEDTAYNGKIWYHNQTFQIEFSEKSFNNIALEDNSTQLLSKFKGNTVEGKYDILVRAYDSDYNVSTQYYYTFEVTSDDTVSRPKFQSTFKMGQSEFYEGNTVKFSVANPTDTYTDDSNIEVKYYVSIDDGKDIEDGTAIEIVNDSKKGMTISGGQVSFIIDDQYEIGKYILDKLKDSGNTDGYLSFRIYAVARNYHAIVSGYQVYNDTYTYTYNNNTYTYAIADCSKSQSDATPYYISAVYDSATIYDRSYGEAAKISAKDGSNNNTWYSDSDKLKQDERVYIPGLKFEYTKDSYFSTITYEVLHQDSGKSINSSAMDGNKVSGGGWQGTITKNNGLVLGGKATDIMAGNPDTTSRFFTSSYTGVHYIIVKVTNAGGNISVFVGKVIIVGTPQYSARLVGGTETMKIGQTASLPSVEITINNTKFTTGGLIGTQGYIVTNENVAENGTRQAKVGTYQVKFGSENNSITNMYGNSFAPTSVDRYMFTFYITIKDDQEGGTKYIDSLDSSVGITIEKTFYISVENLSESDISINLYSSSYKSLGSTVNATDSTKTYANNIFTDMLVDSVEGKTLEMTDAQLWAGLESVASSNDANGVPTSFQYGKIYVPNYYLTLNNEVQNLDNEFQNKANSYITVSYSKSTSGTLLLDTREGSGTDGNIDENIGDGYYWFRPQGLLVPQWNTTDGKAPSATDLVGGKTWKDFIKWPNEDNKWEAVGSSSNNYATVDGEYIITYTTEYNGLTVTRKFNIAMGDTRQPKITYVDTSSSADKFDKTYKVGNSFEFNTSELKITGTKNPSVFTGEYLKDSQNNSSFIITVMRPSGTRLYVGDDDYKITTNNSTFYEAHRFTLKEAGTYTITFQVKSESGVWGVKEYSITVEEKSTAAQIAPEEVWGTILIILSSGLLIGVVIYFIKTGHSTKFASANKKARKQKEEKPDEV